MDGNKVIQYASTIGILVSVYALYVELSVENNPMSAGTHFCDISAWVYCSRVLTSPQGKMLSYFGIVPKGFILDLPNAALGMVFYTAALVHDAVIGSLLGCGSRAARWVMFAASLLSIGASTFLIYTLIAMNDFCVVCAATHVINSVILLASASRVWCGACLGDKQKKQ